MKALRPKMVRKTNVILEEQLRLQCQLVLYNTCSTTLKTDNKLSTSSGWELLVGYILNFFDNAFPFLFPL